MALLQSGARRCAPRRHKDAAIDRPLRVDPIAADDRRLYEATRILSIAIEDDGGKLIIPA